VLSQWSEIPIGPASFDASLKVSVDKDVKGIMPGMACKVKLTAYAKKNALAVPANVVKTDEFDERRYVYLVDKEGKAAKRDVTIGEKTDKLLEITAGLAEGDKVLLEAPKDEK
jgi:multidrug efflux system membrane fusion protein